MKKTLTLVVLFAMTAVSPLFAQEKNIKVIDQVWGPLEENFSSTLGSDRYTIDSLVVTYSYFYPELFPLLRDCCEKGRLTGIDMSHTDQFWSYIPANAFAPTIVNGKPAKSGSEAEKDYTRTDLRYFTLPVSIGKIEDMAFACTNLETITIPSITHLGNGAFSGCEKLKDVYLIGNRDKSREVEVAFDGLASGAVLHVAKGFGSLYDTDVIRKTFSEIREDDDLYNVMDITLDGSRALEDMAQGRILFVDSMKLSGTVTEADMEYLRDNACWYGRLKNLDLSDCTVFVTEGIYNSRFEYLRLPKQMTVLDDALLSMSAVDHLVMPESYEEIRRSAFEKYKWFEDSTLVIPEGCRKLEYRAFANCTSIKKLVLPSTMEVLEPSSLGFSLWNEWEGLEADIYVNRMYPPTSTNTYGDREITNSKENGPFSCHEDYNGTASCQTRNMRLFVPVGAKKNYENAEHWDHFRTIIETPLLTGTPSGIAEAVTTFKPTSSSAADGIYTVDGRLVTRDTAAKGQLRGLYVVRENGTARKVVF